MGEKKISLKPIINKRNSQINFSLRKSDLPKDMRCRLGKLKSVNIDLEGFKF